MEEKPTQAEEFLKFLAKKGQVKVEWTAAMCPYFPPRKIGPEEERLVRAMPERSQLLLEQFKDVSKWQYQILVDGKPVGLYEEGFNNGRLVSKYFRGKMPGHAGNESEIELIVVTEMGSSWGGLLGGGLGYGPVLVRKDNHEDIPF